MTARVRGAQLLLALAAVLLSLILLEGVLRLFGWFPPKSQYSAFIEYDPERGWRNKPGTRGFLTSDEFRIGIEYNEHGYRGPTYPYAKPPGTRRVLLLGDSFVEGIPVSGDERVSEQLSLLLSNEEIRTEVVPLGTGGYGTDQELLWLLDEGLRYSPDFIIVMFYYNDVWYNTTTTYNMGAKPRFVIDGDSLLLTNVPVPRAPARTPEQPFPRKAAIWLSRHTHIGALASRAVKSSTALRSVASAVRLAEPPSSATLARNLDAPRHEEFRVFERGVQPGVDEAWLVTERLLLEMRRRADSAGAELMLFHIPFRFSLRSPDGALPDGSPVSDSTLDFAQLVDRFRVMCTRLAVRCIEPTEEFEKAGAGGRRLYFQYDWHWTADGHALAARMLADSLAPDLARLVVRKPPEP